MRYAKPSQEAADDFAQARDQIEAAGGVVLSGAWAAGVLTVETEQPIGDDLRLSLGLTPDQGD
jgi:hypothetical protein